MARLPGATTCQNASSSGCKDNGESSGGGGGASIDRPAQMCHDSPGRAMPRCDRTTPKVPKLKLSSDRQSKLAFLKGYRIPTKCINAGPLTKASPIVALRCLHVHVVLGALASDSGLRAGLPQGGRKESCRNRGWGRHGLRQASLSLPALGHRCDKFSSRFALILRENKGDLAVPKEKEHGWDVSVCGETTGTLQA